MRNTLIVLLFMQRWITSMIWVHFDMPEIYYFGQSVFETGAIALLLTKEEGWLRVFLNFFLGLSVYNIIRELFLNPLEIDVTEYVGAVVGAVFVAITITKKYHRERNKGAN